MLPAVYSILGGDFEPSFANLRYKVSKKPKCHYIYTVKDKEIFKLK
jgi:hypothetical protein